jgi:hypothetical protein
MKAEDLQKYAKLFMEPLPPKQKSPMHLAVETKSYKLIAVMVSIFIKLNLNFEIKNGDDLTPYELAVKIGEKYIDNIGNATPEDRKDLENIVKIKQFLSKYNGKK